MLILFFHLKRCYETFLKDLQELKLYFKIAPFFFGRCTRLSIDIFVIKTGGGGERAVLKTAIIKYKSHFLEHRKYCLNFVCVL